MDNTEYMLVVYLASMFCRITIFPINYESSIKEIERLSKETNINNILTDKKYIRSKILNIFKTNEIKKLNKSEYHNILHKKQNLNEKEFDYIISLSSGTSGRSKKIILTNLCKFRRALHTIKYYKLGKSTRTIICTPLYHSLAQRLFFIPIISGNKLVLLKDFSVEKWFNFVKEHKINFSILVSTHVRRLIKSKNINLSSLKDLKNLISSSDSISVKDKLQMIKKFNCNLHEIYGTSETATITNLNLRSDTKYLKSVGKLLDDTKIRIKKKNKKIGAILCKNTRMFKGYFDKKRTFKDYFNTGDLGYLNSKGYLFFKGREKDIIKISGMNVNPTDVEEKILTNKNVKECTIVGEKNEHFGEIIKCFVVPVNKLLKTEENIKKFIRNYLNKFECPQIIKFVEQLPKNKLGKILKRELRNNSFLSNKKNIKKYNNLINLIN